MSLTRSLKRVLDVDATSGIIDLSISRKRTLTCDTRLSESNPPQSYFTVGWICALQEEFEAACRMLDEEFDGPDTSEMHDDNTYVFGSISGHGIVIGCLPSGSYGIGSAASVAKDMVRTFPGLRFALMVGIGGGAPTHEKDIRLGDVVVSRPQNGLGGVVQYDFGKRLSTGRFQQSGQLNRPPPLLLGVLPEMQRRHNDPRKPDRLAEHINLMGDTPCFNRPPVDNLYRAEYLHNDGRNCDECDDTGLERRVERRNHRQVTVHYGIIASANTVMSKCHCFDPY